MPPEGFEPTISPGELPQTYALDRAATGTGILTNLTARNLLRNVENYSFGQEIRWFILVFGNSKL